MEGLSSLLDWFVENEAALSGVAATVVILGFVASPLGAGLRGLVRRRTSYSEGDATPTPDIPVPPEPEADRPSIAVMPFLAVSKDEDSEIFADGMTNDIITALGHVSGFFVTSGNSTFVYKGQSIDTRQIGRELGVRYVVEGRIQRAGDAIRINSTLVEASSGDQIWSEQFSGDLSDIFVLQDNVTQSIVGRLQPELLQAESRRGARTPTENLDAWTLLHSAQMKFQVGFSRVALTEAIVLTEAALEKDPDYAEAHGLLTFVLMDWIAGRWSDDLERDKERATTHCRRALELDPENPIVLYSATVFGLFMTGDLDKMTEQIERCCAINPNDAFAHAVRSHNLASTGREEEALEAIDTAFRLSPRDPRTFFLLGFKAYTHLSVEQYGEAELISRRSSNLKEGYFWAWVLLAISTAMQGKKTEASNALVKLGHVAPDFQIIDLEKTLTIWNGHPTGERRALIDSWVDSLRDIWPASDV